MRERGRESEGSGGERGSEPGREVCGARCAKPCARGATPCRATRADRGWRRYMRVCACVVAGAGASRHQRAVERQDARAAGAPDAGSRRTDREPGRGRSSDRKGPAGGARSAEADEAHGPLQACGGACKGALRLLRTPAACCACPALNPVLAGQPLPPRAPTHRLGGTRGAGATEAKSGGGGDAVLCPALAPCSTRSDLSRGRRRRSAKPRSPCSVRQPDCTRPSSRTSAWCSQRRRRRQGCMGARLCSQMGRRPRRRPNRVLASR